jgi:hypothetical protein
VTEATEPTAPTPGAQPIRSDVIKRTTAPHTTNGTRWEVQLSAVPAREWLEFFKRSGEASASSASSPQPGRVTFDRASIVFKSDEQHVEEWIESLDKWIAWTDARYGMSLDEADRERSIRLDAEERQRERIQQLNERFKHL